MEAVDRGDVGEDPCNDVLRDSSLCELSAKYLRRKTQVRKIKIKITQQLFKQMSMSNISVNRDICVLT